MAIAYNKRTHRCGELRASNVDTVATLSGWVHTVRDHGGMAFVDIFRNPNYDKKIELPNL